MTWVFEGILLALLHDFFDRRELEIVDGVREHA